MVICLQRKIKIIFRYVIIFLLVFIVSLLSNYFSYIRYSDKEIIQNNLLVLENKALKNKIKEFGYFENEYIVGKVVVRNLYNFYDEIIIDTNNKVNVGNAVVNEEGLIGVVSKVNKKTYVKLLTSNYKVSVIIGDCYGNLSNSKVDMVDKDCQINKGDVVSTSGLNNISRGIYIGKVKSVKESNLGFVVDVDLIDNKYLNYVGVIR